MRWGIQALFCEGAYVFSDHFSSNRETVTAPAVAFGQEPSDPNTACFAVVLSNGESGIPLISRYRALGAPRALEITDDAVIHWRVSSKISSADRQVEFDHKSLHSAFMANHDKWKPSSVLRAKNITANIEMRQLDFIDIGLLPALESHVREKLDPLLKHVLSQAKDEYRKKHRKTPQVDRLFTLVFRALTGKVMHDRGLEPFAAISGPKYPGRFLKMVADHYHDPKPIIDDLDIQKLVFEVLWSGISLAHLSIDILAYVWENLLVTDDIRERLSIHATPPNVARFLVETLIHDAPETGRTIVEPCCGSGTFLIAALQRLRELLPTELNVSKRHDYFARMLRGFDQESFGLEVSQSCLLLADFPNHNGWQLKEEDVFEEREKSPKFYSSLDESRFVLCNPPFKDFSQKEKRHYRVSFSQKPVELFHRVLDHMPSDAEVGFVLPYQAIDGRSYAGLRERIAKRFEEIDLVHLAEGVFEKAKFPTVLFVARKPRHTGNKSEVRFSVAKDPTSFKNCGRLDRTEVSEKRISEIRISLAAVELADLWSFLSSCRTLSTATEDIARGVEWEKFDPKVHISKDPKRGFLPGFHKAESLRCFEPPILRFLNAKKEDRRRKAWDKPWHLPKVVCNAVRKSQGPWKICACAVDLNLLCTQNFTVLWSKSPWTAKSLAAVMNGPVACAFMATHENWKHLSKEILSQMPIPALTETNFSRLDSLVGQYETVASVKRDGIEIAESQIDSQLTNLLIQIDWLVLSAYDLPKRLKEMLLSYFIGHSRSSSVQYDIQELATEKEPSGVDEAVSWDVVERALRENRV